MFNPFRKKPSAPPPSDAEHKLALVGEYLDNAITSFERDPADTDFQRGYLAAHVEAREWFREL